MATYNQIAYMIYDKLGLGSDDGNINIDHILFLMNTFRSLLIKQQYLDAKKTIPITNYQTICIELEQNTDCVIGTQVQSKDKIPHFSNIGIENIIINPIGDLFNNLEWTLVSDKRFSAVGNNKWLKNIVYFTEGTNNYLYLKSMNINFKYIKKIEVSALFENPEEASKFACNSEGNNCDFLDTEYPLEGALIPALLQLIDKELNNPIYRPEDEDNNASDDLSGLGGK